MTDPVHLSDTQGEAIRLIVDDTVYAIDATFPLDGDGPITDIRCRPYREIDGREYPDVELQFVDHDHTDAVVKADPPSNGVDETELVHITHAGVGEYPTEAFRAGYELGFQQASDSELREVMPDD